MAKIFNIPFATTGDREPIPQEAQEDNHVSYTEGYTEEYGIDPATSADALDIERAKFNGLVHDITEAIFELQRHGVALWSADAAPYPAKARVYHNGAVWSSPSGNNNQVPGEGSGWVLNEVIFSTEAQALLGEDGGTAMSPLRTHQAFNQYGLGVKQKNVFTGDVRTLDAEGSYRVGPAATRTPVGAPGTLVVRVLDPDNRTLVFVGQGTSPTIYYTQLRSGVWDEEWYTVWSSQNQLPLGKTAETGRAALELGSAAVADVGTSTGNVMAVGSFGLGNSEIDGPTISDVDDYTIPAGFYAAVNGVTQGTHPPGIAGYSLLVLPYRLVGPDQLWTQQIAVANADRGNTLWVRGYDGSLDSWSSWSSWSNSGIGVGQSWQDLSSSRAAGVTYTNTAGRTIAVMLSANCNTLTNFWVDGVSVAVHDGPSALATITAIVPNGSSYSLGSRTDAQGWKWLELR